MSDLVSYLFETNAIRFCEENKPFWYTSGKIGPYFINTHFVYGSEKDAVELLAFIDECLADKLSLPGKVFEKVLKQYQTNKIYKNVIDTMLKYIEDNINVCEIDYISGGERRDWFFSNIIAHLLKKPHLSIYKDLSVVAHLSSSRLSVLFREKYGTSFTNYLIDFRMKKAQEFLRETDKSIKDIASLVGYDDYMQFSKMFKKKVGMTPQQYKNTCK